MTSTRLISTLFPSVALLLGWQFRNESIELVSVAGTVLVLLGAWLTSRAESKVQANRWLAGDD